MEKIFTKINLEIYKQYYVNKSIQRVYNACEGMHKDSVIRIPFATKQSYLKNIMSTKKGLDSIYF